jgi:hypothetical protein
MYFLFNIFSEECDGDESVRSGTDIHGLAKVRLKVSAKAATDDIVMNMVRLISDEIRQETQSK